MSTSFRQAELSDADIIWKILQYAIQKRKEEGSNQWQDGYPNPDVVQADIANEHGFVLIVEDEIAGYVAILKNDEPAYDGIEGQWLTTEEFVVFHRVAISPKYLGKGLAQKMFDFIEEYAVDNNIHSVKADTNFDNDAMIRIFLKLGYTYCGEVYFRGSPRRAYEKVLD